MTLKERFLASVEREVRAAPPTEFARLCVALIDAADRLDAAAYMKSDDEFRAAETAFEDARAAAREHLMQEHGFTERMLDRLVQVLA